MTIIKICIFHMDKIKINYKNELYVYGSLAQLFLSII